MIRFRDKRGSSPALVLAARDAARRFVSRRGNAHRGLNALRPLVLDWRRRPRRSGPTPARSGAAPRHVCWFPRYHLHFAASPGTISRTEQTVWLLPGATPHRRSGRREPARPGHRAAVPPRQLAATSPARLQAAGAGPASRPAATVAGGPHRFAFRWACSPAAWLEPRTGGTTLVSTSGGVRTVSEGVANTRLVLRSSLHLTTSRIDRHRSERPSAPRPAFAGQRGMDRREAAEPSGAAVVLLARRRRAERLAGTVPARWRLPRQFQRMTVAPRADRPLARLVMASALARSTSSRVEVQRVEVQRVERYRTGTPPPAPGPRSSGRQADLDSAPRRTPGASGTIQSPFIRVPRPTRVQPRPLVLDAGPWRPESRRPAVAAGQDGLVPRTRARRASQHAQPGEHPLAVESPEERIWRRGRVGTPPGGDGSSAGPAQARLVPQVRPPGGPDATSRAFDREQSKALSITRIDPALLERLAEDVVRRVEQRARIERQRRGL